jgi:hypothetical protein
LIIIAVILSSVFVCGCNEEKNGNGGGNTFIGRWKLDNEGIDETWNFKEDGSAIKITKREDGTSLTEYYSWEDTGFELCITPNINPEGERCGTYEFSNNFNSFIWKPIQDLEIPYNRIE